MSTTAQAPPAHHPVVSAPAKRLVEQELELTTTGITHQIHALTTELHRRLVVDPS